MVQTQELAVRCECHPDCVEAELADARVGALDQPATGHPADLSPLARMHRFERVPAGAVGDPAFDLTEHDLMTVAGDDVELSPARAVVAIQDLEAPADQMVCCELFTGVTEPAASFIGHTAKLGGHMCRICHVS